MKIETYIGQLLYRYQCVTVPGFGAFLTETQSAKLNESTNSFFPPKKMISFNSLLKNNDGLLANHIAHAEKTSYGFAVGAIAFEILNWKKTLEEFGVLNLKNIGEIRINADDKMIFTPNDQMNYLSGSFGLSPFVSPLVKREIFERKLEEIQEKETYGLYEDEETKSSNPYLKYAAIIVLALGITGSIGYPLYQNQIANQTLIVEGAVQKKVDNKIQEATFFIQNPLPAVTLSVDSVKTETAETKTMMSYHIMAGAFRSEQNAKKAYDQLVAKGYKPRILEANKHGLIPVLYGSYATMAEAEKAQKEIIQKEENPEAWILVETL